MRSICMAPIALVRSGAVRAGGVSERPILLMLVRPYDLGGIKHGLGGTWRSAWCLRR